MSLASEDAASLRAWLVSRRQQASRHGRCEKILVRTVSGRLRKWMLLLQLLLLLGQGLEDSSPPAKQSLLLCD